MQQFLLPQISCIVLVCVSRVNKYANLLKITKLQIILCRTSNIARFVVDENKHVVFQITEAFKTINTHFECLQACLQFERACEI